VANERRWACANGHSFDVSRDGYLNLLRSGSRRSRQAGDSDEMVRARQRFLATGAFDPLTEAVRTAVASVRPSTVLDVGCGEGRHTRALEAALVMGIDLAKRAISVAARADKHTWYAVASAADIPLPASSVDVVVNIFGPVMPEELARVMRPSGMVVAAHPGPDHLGELRSIVYEEPLPHEVKPPLRNAAQWFSEVSSSTVLFPVHIESPSELNDLFTMTPYRWHAPPDVGERIESAARGGFETVGEVRVTCFARSRE
jgi:23S rRNA (guanine745-N1)-methyltransferase